MSKFQINDKVRLIKHLRYPQWVGLDGEVSRVTEKVAASSAPVDPVLPPVKKEMVYGVRLSNGEILHDVPESWLDAIT